MKKVKITAIHKVQYDDLMAKYENRRTKQEQSQACLSYALQGGGRPIGHPLRHNDKLPLGILKGDAFITKWRKNDGFRPVSFYIETIE